MAISAARVFFAGNGAYEAATDFHLGTYGVDVAGGAVWAVLNHNSDFAVNAVPEPSSWVFLGLGLGVFLVFRKRNPPVGKEVTDASARHPYQ